MIEVIATLYDSITNELVASKKVCFPDKQAGRLSLMWTIRGEGGIAYGETVCRDLPVGDLSPETTRHSIKGSTKVDWIP